MDPEHRNNPADDGIPESGDELSPELPELLKGHREWLASGGRLGRRANLSDADCSRADLSDVVLSEAVLRNTALYAANLRGADLRGADLEGADLRSAEVTNASFRHSNLAHADLRETRDLRVDQLGGADLSGAHLPELHLTVANALAVLQEGSKNARKLFLAIVAACAYSILAIAATRDPELLTNSATSELPILSTEIPITWFYWIGPALLAGTYLYFHLYMQRLWEGLADLPAVFEDGKRLDKKVYPWLVTGLISRYFPRLRAGRPAFARSQWFVAITLSWWMIPCTIYLFWARYLPKHDLIGTSFHLAVLVSAACSGVWSYRTAIDTLRGRFNVAESRRRPIFGNSTIHLRRGLTNARTYTTTVITFSCAFVLYLSLETFFGNDQLPHIPALFFRPFADVTLDSTTLNYADFTGADLRFMRARNAWFVGATFENANLRGANLESATLDSANFSGAQLAVTNLRRASLNAAVLVNATLDSADLTAANFTGANLNNASLMATRGDSASFTGALLRGGLLIRATMRSAVFDSANLAGARLSGLRGDHVRFNHADLRRASLHHAVLAEGLFSQTDLTGALLTGADLAESTFRSAILFRAVMDSVNAHGASFEEADLFGADLTAANVAGTQFTRADLRFANVKGLHLGRVTSTSTRQRPSGRTQPGSVEDRISQENRLYRSYPRIADLSAGSIEMVIFSNPNPSSRSWCNVFFIDGMSEPCFVLANLYGVKNAPDSLPGAAAIRSPWYFDAVCVRDPAEWSKIRQGQEPSQIRNEDDFAERCVPADRLSLP